MDLLRMQGYTVLGTGDPRVALRMARTRTEPIHLLLTDVLIPLMSGKQLAQELRAIRPDVQVLFMSACSIETVEDYRIALAPGEPFLAKPFTIAELDSAVRAALAYFSPFARPGVGRGGVDMVTIELEAGTLDLAPRWLARPDPQSGCLT